jgi:hypothetical protein
LWYNALLINIMAFLDFSIMLLSCRPLGVFRLFPQELSIARVAGFRLVKLSWTVFTI